MNRRFFAAIVGLLVAAFFFHHHAHRQPVATIASWGQPGAPGSQPAPDGFTDPTGQHTIGGSCGTWEGEFPQICDSSGRVTGLYIDDTAPDQATWVNLALADGQTVYVGIPPVAGAGSACPYSQPGVMCLQEYYPYDCRNLGVWGPLPKLSGNTVGFILQQFFHWDSCGPPTPSEVQHLVSLAEQQHPTLVLLY